MARSRSIGPGQSPRIIVLPPRSHRLKGIYLLSGVSPDEPYTSHPEPDLGKH